MVTLDLGIAGYLIAAMAYTVLLAILLIGWRERGFHGALLIAVALLSACWAALSAWQQTWETIDPQFILMSELIRDGVWVAFLWRVLRKSGPDSIQVPNAIDAVAAVAGVLVLGSMVLSVLPEPYQPNVSRLLLFAKIGLVLSALILTEHLFRYTAPHRRWAIKYLCIAVFGIFAFDFYRYTEALLFQSFDVLYWEERGYIHSLVVPLIAVSAARNPQWNLDVYVSRRLVFHSAVLVAAGIYLITMAAAGYYLRRYGGDWGRISLVVLIFAAILLLAVIALSTQARARARVFISKHFFNYRYDYREEWLRMTRTLVSGPPDEGLSVRAIRALADIVESPGGQLWLMQPDGRLLPEECWNSYDTIELSVAEEELLKQFLLNTEWVIELDEYRKYPDRYQDLKLPDGLLSKEKLWLIVPLLHDEELVGLILLVQSRATKDINWEDRDILKVAAREVAGFLAQSETLRALTEARQFEGFNRLSAYVIHDLKNLIAQLSLVVSNARRHRDNPEFLKDVIGTVENSVLRMTKLLEQLRTGTFPRQAEMTDLVEIARQAAEMCATNVPRPQVEDSNETLMIKADRERLISVVNHLIQNAQEATPSDGSVVVRLWREGKRAYLEVEDNGSGMTDDFIRERLFRPFDTTKGLTGMGIGAFEGRELFRALGGDIVVESEPEKGTRLLCYVPISELGGALSSAGGESVSQRR